MRYHNITHDDMLNGDGLRVVLWTAGCTHHCEGCQNPITWDENGGIPFDDSAKDELFEQLSKDYISGITFSGGDPLAEFNRKDITCLAKEIKETFPTKTIWCYTGFLYEEIKNLEIIQYIDVLVEGEFELSSLDVTLQWKGSGNQRVIPVKEMADAVSFTTYAQWHPVTIDYENIFEWDDTHITNFWLKPEVATKLIAELFDQSLEAFLDEYVYDKSEVLYQKAKDLLVCERTVKGE